MQAPAIDLLRSNPSRRHLSLISLIQHPSCILCSLLKPDFFFASLAYPLSRIGNPSSAPYVHRFRRNSTLSVLLHPDSHQNSDRMATPPVRQWGVTPPISMALPTKDEVAANDDLIAELKAQNNFEAPSETERRCVDYGNAFQRPQGVSADALF